MINMDYSSIRPLKKRGIFQKYKKEVGGALLIAGFSMLFIASGETKPNFSIMWNIWFGGFGIMFAVFGLRMLNLLRHSTEEWQ